MDNRFVEEGDGLVWPEKPASPTIRGRKVAMASIRARKEDRSLADVMKEEGLI